MLLQFLSLKRDQRYDEAIALVQPLLHDDNCDANLRRAYGVLLAEKIEQEVRVRQYDHAMEWLDLFTQANFPEDEVGVYKQLTDALRSLVKQLAPLGASAQKHLDAMFDRIQTLPLHVTGINFSIFITFTLKCKQWTRCNEFAYWCGWEHLMPNDFKPFLTQSGQKILAQAEKICIRMANYLLDNKLHDEIPAFIPRLTKLYNEHPEYTYPPYYLTLLYIELGQLDSARETLMPFIRKKSRDFWVWQLMAQVQEQPEAKLACYCKALLCGSRKEEMLVKLYAEAANAFLQNGRLPLAKWLIDQVCAIRRKMNWHISHELINLTRQAWYRSIIAAKDEAYIQEQAQKAEILVLGHVQKPKNNRQSSNDTAKPFSGKLKKTPKGFGFVRDTHLGDIYIPARLAEKLTDGALVCGKAQEKLDTKKNKMGYAAIKIHSTHQH